MLVFSTTFVAVGCVNNRKPPVLSVPPVDISRLVKTVAFGARVNDGRNPEVSYQVDNDDVEVRAVISGIVTGVGKLGFGTSAFIQIQEFRICQWQVSQSDIFNPKVNIGDRVVAGQILGTVGLNGLGTPGTGVSVLNRQGDDEVYYCPISFATDEFIRQHGVKSLTCCLVETLFIRDSDRK